MRFAWLACLERPSGCREPGAALSVISGGVPRASARRRQSLAPARHGGGRRGSACPPGAVLALEDVTEAPYRVDRMLTSLQLGGHLARASAIVFGAFTRCPTGADGRSVEEVLADRTADLGIPVLSGAPFGHEAHNEAFVLGAPSRVVKAMR